MSDTSVEILTELVECIEALSGPNAHHLGCECGGSPDRGKNWCGKLNILVAKAKRHLDGNRQVRFGCQCCNNE